MRIAGLWGSVDVQVGPFRMKNLDLDSLLGNVYSEATFHDSELLSLNVQFARGAVKFMFRVPIGVADGDTVYRTGTLAVTGLLFLAMDPPANPPAEWRESALWITSDGPFPDPQVRTGIKLPDGLPNEAFCHYLRQQHECIHHRRSDRRDIRMVFRALPNRALQRTCSLLTLGRRPLNAKDVGQA